MSDPSLLVFAPLRLEAIALGDPDGWRVLRSGMGAPKARIAAARGLAVEAARGLAVAGVCAAVAPGLEAGDIVLGSELRGPGLRPLEVPGSALLAAALRRRGLRAHVGAIASVQHVTTPGVRRDLQSTGVLAVDMESAWLAGAAAGRPLAVLRVVVEAAGRKLLDPRTVVAGSRALVALRRARGALAEWALAIGGRRVLLAAPRSFCAGDDGEQAVGDIARESDVVLVVASDTSANSTRLVEVAEREGARAFRVNDETDVDVAWLKGAATVGLTAGASAPELLVRRLIGAIGALGEVVVEERTATTEPVRFRLPQEVAAR